jgi:hypothetical protein
LALVEKARIRAARRDYKGADEFLSKTRFPTPDGLILSGDLYAVQGKTAEAEQRYQAAEDLARGLEGDLHRFALLWADHDTRLEEALLVAQNDYATNKDIYAADILAWCFVQERPFTGGPAGDHCGDAVKYERCPNFLSRGDDLESHG